MIINAFINQLIQQLFEYLLWSKPLAKWWDMSVTEPDMVLCLHEA